MPEVDGLLWEQEDAGSIPATRTILRCRRLYLKIILDFCPLSGYNDYLDGEEKMAKVVGRNEKHVHTINCRKCTAIVEYVENEIREYSGTDWSGGPNGHTWVDCPSCGKKIILTSW